MYWNGLMEKHRVRPLIRYLTPRYGELRNRKILPKKLLFTKVGRGGKFPTLAAKMGYSQFGSFMEQIIQNCLLLKGEELFDAIKECQQDSYLPESLQKYFNPMDYLKIGEMVREHFPDDLPTFEPEWEATAKDGIIQGHPDVVDDNCVYDIKTTGKFNAMRTETIFQILSYYCLSKKQGLDVTHIGLILPAQLTIFYEDIRDWDWEPFWNELCGCIKEKCERETLYMAPPLDAALFLTMRTRVGTHVAKKDLERYMLFGFPLQFFLGGRSSTKVLTLTKRLTKKLKERQSPPIFIHAPYCLNLSRPEGKFKRKRDDDLDLPWVCHTLLEILDTGEKAGLNGVVIHCGKQAGLPLNKAVYKMLDSLEEIADAMPEDINCPLLVETSAGEKGEVLSDPSDLADFYHDLSEDAQKKIGICVDTCHVFAAGHNPMEFVQVLVERKVPIKEIHFNDSLLKKGSCRDRHAPIGYGWIGYYPLFQVLSWALDNNVPCVTE